MFPLNSHSSMATPVALSPAVKSIPMTLDPAGMFFGGCMRAVNIRFWEMDGGLKLESSCTKLDVVFVRLLRRDLLSAIHCLSRSY